MKVLLVAKTFHPPFATGATAFAIGLLKAILAIDGVEVTLLSTSRPRNYLLKVVSSEALESHSRVFRQLLCRVEKSIYLEEVKKNALVSKIAILNMAKKLIENESFSMIHDLYGIAPYIAFSSPKRIQAIWHIVTPATHLRDAILKFSYALLKPSLHPAFSSEFIAKSYGNGINGFIIPPAIDTELYRPVNAYTQKSDYDYTILYIGPVTLDRFPPQVIKALALAKPQLKGKVILKIITGSWRQRMESSYISYLKNLSLKLNLDRNVEIASKTLTLEEKLALINKCNVFIQIFDEVPRSIVPIDPPITLLEAMACGKTVIASKSMSIPQIIKHRYNGYLLNGLSEKHIADVLIEAINADREVGIRAREVIVRNFSISKISSIIRSLYKLLSC